MITSQQIAFIFSPQSTQRTQRAKRVTSRASSALARRIEPTDSPYEFSALSAISAVNSRPTNRLNRRPATDDGHFLPRRRWIALVRVDAQERVDRAREIRGRMVVLGDEGAVAIGRAVHE